MKAASRSHHPLALALVLALACAAGRSTASIAGGETANAAAAAAAADADGDAGISVTVDLESGRPRGRALATVRIHAGLDAVWNVLTTCAGALEIVPGLVGCEVLKTAPDGSAQRIRHVLDYSWYLPRLTYELEASYDRPARIRLKRVAGDLKQLEVGWDLVADGADTVGHYQVTLDPGFWVPQWVVRAVLKRDLPRMLRALRQRAQLSQGTPSH